MWLRSQNILTEVAVAYKILTEADMAQKIMTEAVVAQKILARGYCGIEHSDCRCGCDLECSGCGCCGIEDSECSGCGLEESG